MYGDYSTYGSYGSYSPYIDPSPYSARMTEPSANRLLAWIVGLGAAVWIIAIVLCVLMFVGLWKAYKKAGYAGYESLIPGHNTYVKLKISGLKGYYYFLTLVTLVPIVGWIALIGIDIWWSIEFAKAYGKGTGFGVGIALLPCIFLPILGLGNAKYIGPQNSSNPNQYASMNPNNGNQYTSNGDYYTATTQQNVNTVVPPVEPVKPVAPVEPVRPVTPVETVKPVEPVQPVQTVNQYQPTAPAEPVRPVTPVEPVVNNNPTQITNNDFTSSQNNAANTENVNNNVNNTEATNNNASTNPESNGFNFNDNNSKDDNNLF